MEGFRCSIRAIVGQRPENITGDVKLTMKSGAPDFSSMPIGREPEDYHIYIILPVSESSKASELVSMLSSRWNSLEQSIPSLLGSATKKDMSEVEQAFYESEKNVVIDLKPTGSKLAKLQGLYELLNNDSKLEKAQEISVHVEVGTILRLALINENPLISLLYSFSIEILANTDINFDHVINAAPHELKDHFVMDLAKMTAYLNSLEADLEFEGPSELPLTVKQHITSSIPVDLNAIATAIGTRAPDIVSFLSEHGEGKGSICFKASSLVFSLEAHLPKLSEFFS